MTIETSCTVQVGSREKYIPKVTEVVKTWAKVKSEGTSVPCDNFIPFQPTLTPCTEPDSALPHVMSKLGEVSTLSNQLHLQSKSQGGGDTNKEGGTPNAAVMAAFNVQYGVQLVQIPQQPKPPMLQSQQSSTYVHIGINLHTSKPDYPFLNVHQQHINFFS